MKKSWLICGSLFGLVTLAGPVLGQNNVQTAPQNPGQPPAQAGQTDQAAGAAADTPTGEAAATPNAEATAQPGQGAAATQTEQGADASSATATSPQQPATGAPATKAPAQTPATTPGVAPVIPPLNPPPVPVVPAQPTPEEQARLDAARQAGEKLEVEGEQRRANLGSDEDAYTLGLRYLEGNGVDRDENEARRWLIKAATNGYAKAQTKLKELNGVGAPPAGQSSTTTTKPDK